MPPLCTEIRTRVSLHCSARQVRSSSSPITAASQPPARARSHRVTPLRRGQRRRDAIGRLIPPTIPSFHRLLDAARAEAGSSGCSRSAATCLILPA
jgi:hypothetical protein